MSGKIRRILSLVMAMMMVFNGMPVAAFAEGELVHEHVYNIAFVTGPTCTEGGYTTYTCGCGANYVADETVALGHSAEVLNGSTPTCTVSGWTEGSKCSVCGEVLTVQEEIAAPGHTAEVLPAVAATETTDGLTEGSKCSVCGEVLVAQEVVPATGCSHQNVTVLEAVAPTCTAAGLTEGSVCAACGEVLAAQAEVAALGHTAEVLPAVAATETETGLTEGSKCAVCGEVLVAQEVVPVVTPVAPECAHANVVVLEAVAPTCAAAGLTEGAQCADCGAVVTAQTEIPVVAEHTPVVVPAVDATCAAAGLTEGSVCGVCGVALVEQTEIPLSNEHNYEDYTCTVCGAAEPVAAIGDAVFATLQDAFTVGGHVALLRDVQLDQQVVVPSGVTVVLDMNGNSLSLADNHAILNNGSLTVEGNGKIAGIYNKGELVLNSGRIVGTASFYALAIENGTVELNDGSIYYNEENALEYSIVLSGGELNVPADSGVTVANDVYALYVMGGTANIAGGTFNAIAQAGGSVTVTGGTIYGDVSAYLAAGYVQNADGKVEKKPVMMMATAPKAADVAKIGEQGFETLADALAVSKETDTITLLADAELYTPIGHPDYNFVYASAIELNGHTMTIKEGKLRFSTCTIKNGNIVVDASGDYSGNGVFYMFDEKVLTLDNVKLKAENLDGYSIFCMENKSDLILQNTEVTVNNCKLYGIVAAVSDGENIIDNSKITANTLTGRGFLNGNYTVKGNSEITLTGVTKDGFYIGEGDSLNIQDNAQVNITLNADGDARYGINLNKNADYSKAETATVVSTTNRVYVAQIGETQYQSLQAAIDAAVDGDEVKILVAGTYAVPSGKSITITGAVDGVEFDNIGEHNMGGANVNFNNVTFNYANDSHYKGLQYAGNMVYNNCTFNGQVFLYGTSETFNNCTFEQTSSDYYNVWTYSAKNVAFNECTFNSAGKSVLIYHEAESVFNNVAVAKSTFNASAAVEGKAAIEMDSSLTAGIKLTVDSATTATGFATGNVSGNSLWNNKKGNETEANDDITVKVGNEIKLAPKPKGSITPAFTNETAIWGEGGGNATKSLVVQLYEGENVIAIAELNNIGGIIDGDVYVTWQIPFAASNDEYWTVTWAEGYPKADMAPDTVAMVIDGTEVAFNNCQLNGPDDLNKIVAAAEKDGKFLGYYTTLDAAVNAANGGTVCLLTDLTVEAIDATDATIDLNGKTLNLTKGDSNFYGKSSVKNGTINISGCVVSGDCIIGIGDYSNSAELTLNNVQIKGENYSSGYAVLYVYNSSTLNINGGSIVVSKDNASAGGVIKAHSAANGKINITGTESDPVKLTFNNAKIGMLDGTVVMNYVDLDITGGANGINQSALTVKNSTLTIKNCDGRALTLSQGDVVIENSTLDFSGATEGEIRFKKALTLNVDEKSSITECDIWTDVVGAKVNNSVVNGTEKEPSTISVASGAVLVKNPKLNGTGTEEDPFLINNLDDLLLFRDNVDKQLNDGTSQYAGKYIKLNADIDLAGINWDPIGSMSGDHGSFKGVFDGNGHTISNLYVKQSGNGLGLFARTADNAVIKNLNLNNVTVKSTNDSSYVGGLVGNAYASTKIENVHVTGNIDISGRGYIGGIAGHGYVVMDNVSVKGSGTIYSTFWCAGGVLGYAGEGTTNIMNAEVEGLTITSAAGGLGAIVGMAEDNNGTQPISGSNLSAKNVDIETYTGAYGDAYANYALGYLYGGNPTSKLSGNLSVENVKVETSNGTAPTFADAVAQVGGNVYFNLQSAVNAGGEVVVLRDITQSEALTISDGAVVSIDLNGKTLNGCIMPCAPASLTVKNGSIVNNNASYSGIEVNAGKLNLENVNITSARHAVRIDGSVEATINDGEYKLSATSGTRHALNVSGAANVTIKNGTFVGPKGTTMDSGAAVNVQAGSKVTIEGGSFSKGKNNTLSVAGMLTISGGTFDQDPSAYLHADYKAVLENAVYNVVPKLYVAQIGEAKYESFAEALSAVQDGETITLLTGAKGDESKTEIEFNKDIEFTITGVAPNYALPVVTFQNATVNIKDAEILIPELDARQNATINVIDSTVHDAGGNSIVKSYYNGAINISGTSVVHTMQVTTMGYITISDSAKLNATWQTNVYGNGMITIGNGATFNTAALHLTGKEYSGRDNTDADRVGKPATIVVDGATFTVGKVVSNNGADYSYNSSKGINIGTIAGKSAVLDIKNGANVNIYMANGETANIGADGTVNVDGSTFKVACRGEGSVQLNNNGDMRVTDSKLTLKKYKGNTIELHNATLTDSYIDGGVNAFGTNAITGTTTIDGILSLGYETTPTEQVVVTITGNFNGTNVLVTTATDYDHVLNVGDANGERTTAYFGQLGAFGDVVINNTDVTYGYTFIRNDFAVTNSTMAINGGVNTYISGNAKVVLDNSTWNMPGYANIGSYGGYMYGNADVTLKNGSSINATNLGVELSNGKTVKVTLEDSSSLTANKLTNQGTIVLASMDAKLNANEVGNVTTTVPDYKVVYENGEYKFVAKHYVAQIGEAKYESFEEAIAAAVADSTITEIKVLCNSTLDSVKNTENYYDITGNLKITADQKVTVSGCNFAVRVMGNGASLTISENVTIEGMNVVANGFATTGENMTIDGTLKALSLKQWTNNGTITVSETGKVWLGYGDGQFDMAYGNGTVTVTGNGDKTEAQFKAGYSGTRGNGNTLNLKDTYFEGGAWFNVNGSNGTINVDNALLKVSGGDGAGSLTIASTGNTINLTNGAELAVANLTIGANNTVKLGAGSKIASTQIAGAGIIEIDITGMTVGEVSAIAGDLSGFTGKIEVVGDTSMFAKIENGKIVLKSYAAMIGKVGYETLAAALNAAQNGETITLIWAKGAAPIAMNGSVFGKTVTITGTALVDWSKGFLFVGRGGEGNGTVIFDNANLTSASDNASTGIHVSGREKNTNNKYDGTLVINNSTIELDFLINKGIMTLNNSTLTVKKGFAVGGRPASETESGEDATATITLTNGSKVVVNNHNGMGLGYEAIGVMNVDATSSFETTQSFLVTAKGTMNVNGTVKVAGTLTNNGSIVLADVNATVTSSEAGNVTTTVEDYIVKYVDGAYKLVIGAAKIGDKTYETLQEALKAATADCTITLLQNVTITENWDARYTGAKFAVPVTIDGNSKIIKFTSTINDGSNHDAAFRFEADATVRNLTIDMSEAQGSKFRAISSKANLTVENCTFIGNANANTRAIIFGEGAGANIGNVTVNVTDSTFKNWRKGLSDNENAQDAKSVVATGNTFNNAGVNISAAESIIFNNNKVVDAGVVITSYASANKLNVEAKENTLDTNNVNYITNAAKVDAQEDFVVEYAVSNKAQLNAALAAAKDGDTILMTADIDYGTDQLAIAKAITLDLGGNTLTTRNAFGGMSVKNNPTIKNGTIVHASNTAAIKVWNAVAFENLTIDVQGKGDANKTIGGIVLQSGSTTNVGSIKNVTIKGAALTNGIETYNCGDAPNNVIGSMENVIIDAKGTGMLISAPCGTATNCNIKGGVNGIEIWIKGNYSATLTLEDSKVEGGVYAHDEFSSNPDIVNNGKLSLSVDDATTGVEMEDITLTIARAAAEKVNGVLADVMTNAQAKLNDTYYLTLQDAIDACVAGDNTITLLADNGKDVTIKQVEGVNITIDGANKAYSGTITIHGSARYEGAETLTIQNFNFTTSEAGHYFIDSNSTASAERYAHNVTVKASTFTAVAESSAVNSAAAMRIRQGYNIVIEDVVVNNMHSLFQGYGVSGVKVTDATITGGKNGISVGTSTDVVITGVTIDVAGYGIRADGTGAYTMTVENATIDAELPIVVRNNTAEGYQLTMSGNNILTGNTNGYGVIFTKGDDGKYETPDVSATLNGIENVPVFPAYVAKNSDTFYTSFNAAYEAANAGDTITLLADIEASEVILIGKSVTIDGQSHSVTSNATRVFRVTAGDVKVTLNDVNMVSTAVRVGTNDIRGISIDSGFSNVELTLNNCSVDFIDASACDWAYAVNVTGGNSYTVTVNGGAYEGANVINVRGTNHTIVVKNAALNSLYPNNDVYYGACIWVEQNKNSSVNATGNTFSGSNAVAFNVGTGTAVTESNNIDNTKCVVAKIDATYYTTLAEAFAAAQNNAEVKILKAGTYALSTSGKNITITGAVDGVVFDNIGAKNMDGANVTFNNVTFDYYPNTNYTGLQHSGNLVYNNCTINGQVFLYGESETFNNCTFNQNSADAYNVWTYGAKKVEFNECIFNSAGKSVLVYNEAKTHSTELNVKKSRFEATQAVEGKAAIEIDTSLNTEGSSTIVIDGKTTANNFGTGSVSGNSLWNDKKTQTNLGVYVEDVKVWPLSATVNAVYGISAAGEGEQYRENFKVELHDVNATKDLEVKVYSNSELIATTTLRTEDRDDQTAITRPITGSKTVNIVVAGKLSGSWDTEWIIAPSVAYIPDTIEVYADGNLVATYTPAFDAEEAAAYAALPAVKKVASITNAEGKVAYYATLADAIAAAKAGETIVLLADITEDVTVSKSITIDGAKKNYTGNISVSGASTAATVKNVNFVNGTGYAVTTNRITSITVEDCTVTNYGFGFLYANKSTPTVTVKNVTVDGGNYGMHWVYGSNATLENVTMTNVKNGLYIQNYASKTVTLKNSSITSIGIWERDGQSGVQTFKFEGANTVGSLTDSQYAKYVLSDKDATLTAPEGLNVITSVEDHYVDYDTENRVYKVEKVLVKFDNFEGYAEGETQFGLKFYLSDEFLADEDAYVVVSEEANTVNPEDVTTYYMDEIDQMIPDSKGRYVFKQGIASGEMTGDVTVRFYDGNNNIVPVMDSKDGNIVKDEITRTLIDYVRVVLAAPTAPQKNKDLMVGLVTFGGYAQKSFKIDTDNLAYDVLADFGISVPVVNSVDPSDLPDAIRSDNEIGITYTGREVFLDSDVRMELRFKLNDDCNIDDYTFQLTYTENKKDRVKYVQPEKRKDGRYQITIDSVVPAYWDYMYKITVTNTKTGEIYEVNDSVLAYAKTVIQRSTDENMKNLAKAMVIYNKAANAKFGK